VVFVAGRGVDVGFAGVLSVMQQRNAVLAQLHAPYTWRDRHAELLRRYGLQEAVLRQGLLAAQASSDPQDTALGIVAQLRTMTAQDAAALRALGYHDCAH